VSENALDYQNRSFGRYLKKVREDRKLSLDAVEEMTMHYPGRVTKSHLSRIENGQAEPTFPRMCALSQIYGLPISSMAERFESDLRRASTPPAIAAQSLDELVRQAKTLRVAGRVDEALVLYEAALERHEASDSHGPIALRIDRIACLVQLWRFALAKEECEALLGSANLAGEQRLRVLHWFIVCCHRTGKFTIARMCLDTVQTGLRELPPEHVLHGFFAGQRGNLHMALGEPFGTGS